MTKHHWLPSPSIPPMSIPPSPAAVVTIASALSFGWLRYRFGADIAFLVLAAVTLEAVGVAAFRAVRPGAVTS